MLSVWNFRAVVSQTSIPGETVGGVAKCRQFSQTSKTSEQKEKTCTTLSQMLKAIDGTMRDTCHTFVPYQDSTKEKFKTAKPISS